MTSVNGTLTGAYGTKEVAWELFHSPQASTLIVFFHGCCSGPYDVQPTFYQTTAPLLAADPAISVAFYQSSRKLQKHLLPPEEYADYPAFITRAFGGKTIEDEYADAQAFLETLLNQHAYENVIFVGFSLGGVVATRLAATFKPQHLVLLGSAWFGCAVRARRRHPDPRERF